MDKIACLDLLEGLCHKLGDICATSPPKKQKRSLIDRLRRRLPPRAEVVSSFYDDLLATFARSLESVTAIIAADDPAAMEEMCTVVSELESRLALLQHSGCK